MADVSDALRNFAAELSTADEAGRARLFARAKLLAANVAPQESFDPPVRTLGQYLVDPIEVPPVLVEPFMVVRGGLHATIGRAGKGKTVMSLNRILKWSCGLPLFDTWKDEEGKHVLAPSRPLKILVIENEGAAGLFHRQIGLMLNAEGFLTDEQRKLAKENVLIWGDGGYSNLKLDDPHKFNEVKAGCEKHKPDIVFLEPFRQLWTGEENSSTDMANAIDALLELAQEYECATMIAHHEKKGGHGEDDKMSAARGSSVLEGVVTIMENFESVKGGDFRELSWSKSRHGAAPNPCRMEWVPDAWWYRHVPASELGEAIIKALRENADEPMSVSDLHDVTDETKGKLREQLKELKKEGKVKQFSSTYTGEGSTGPRFTVAQDESKDYGGLSV